MEFFCKKETKDMLSREHTYDSYKRYQIIKIKEWNSIKSNLLTLTIIMHYSPLEQFEKENSLLKEKYSIKTKQYSKLTPEKEPLHFNNRKIDQLFPK